jgi:hypothetical protein
VRLALILVSLSFAVPATAARQPLDTLSPTQAISRAAAASPKPVRAVFQLKVGSAAKARSGYYLDSEANFRSASNLGIVIRASAMPGLTQKYGQDLRQALVGKTIKVIGQARQVAVARGKTTTQVEVTHAGQILSVS